ncbi:MAG TPA: M66 family metalloprotease [Fibrobacteria bacterium]|nr:M66 family metalloprotease [Fibrobacteria bacterium]HOX50678.1 M66 family metalloprotease [Fibrobacteria bacterium]
MKRIPSLPVLLLSALLCGEAAADLNALPSAYGFKEHQFPNAPDSGHCGRAANVSAKLGKVQFAQTHLMEPSWPFFYLAGGRPALVAVHLSGQGASPDVKISVQVKGVTVGNACLAGPEQIPPEAADTAPSLDRLYTMTLPKEWVMPGMSVVVETGIERKAWTAEQLQVKSPTEVNVLMARMQFLDLDDTAWERLVPEPPDFLADLAEALPASVTRLGHFPVTIPFERIVLQGPDSKPLLGCRKDLPNLDGCGTVIVDNSTEVKASLLRFCESISKALGVYYEGGYFYGRSSLSNSGGLSRLGNRVAQGTGYYGFFLHELGHSISLPHWHEVYGKTPQGNWEYEYPYGGPNGDGGGRGETWNWAQTRKAFASPRCQLSNHQDVGVERKDQMSYLGNSCSEARSGQPGPWIGFSDFSAYSIHWFLNGQDSAYRGQVLDRDTLRDFQVPSFLGQSSLVLGPEGRPTLLRRETQPVEQGNVHNAGNDPKPFLMPLPAESKQFLVYGQYHPTLTQARYVYPPVPFLGHGVELIDPTDSVIFEKLKKSWTGPYGVQFLYQHDLTFRFTYADSSTRTGIFATEAVDLEEFKDTTRDWTSDLINFAMVVPADKPLVKVQLLGRPFSSCDCSGHRGDVAQAGSTITARNFLDSAVVLLERTFPGGVSPTGIAPHPVRSIDREALGGRVTVRALDGRIVRSFLLEPGGSLDRRVREAGPGQGIWLVQLATKAGGVSRTVLIH